MADSGLLGKLLGALKGFLNSMSSPLGGYDIDDVKMNAKEGQYSVLYQFGTDHAVKDESGEDISTIQGEKIQLNVLLATANLKQAIEPLLSGLNALGNTLLDTPEAKKKASSLLAVFLGSGRESGDDESLWDDTDTITESISLENLPSIFAVSDNSSAGAKGGLLGVDLTKTNGLPTDGYTYEGQKWSWDTIMGDMLKYSLECELAGGKYGAIENVTLSECAKLIPEYLMKVNAISSPEEIHIDTVALVKPIAIRLQADFKQYYDAAYNKFENLKNVKDTSKEDQEAEEKAKADEEAKAQQQEADDAEWEEAMARAGRGEGFRQGSKQISVTLKKIQGSTSFDILGMASNYGVSDTLDDLDDIITQPEFFDALSEEPQTFTIDVDEDGYDISQGDEVSIYPCASLCEVFKAGIRAYRNFYIIHWMSHGNDMMKLHILAEEMYGEMIQEIDTLGELLVEKQGTVPQLDFPCDYVPVQQYDFQESLDTLKSLISMYIDCIDYAYPNQTSDVQSTLDEWLRYWNKQMNYFIKGQEE